MQLMLPDKRRCKMKNTTDNKIKLLQLQLDKLEGESFDLQAWKSSTIIVLERIFGPDNRKMYAIEQIKYELSSWSLRDTKGSGSQLASCKQQGKEILSTAIDELKLLGSPINENMAPTVSALTEALGQELKLAQYYKVIEIIKSDEKQEVKRDKIAELFEALDRDALENIWLNFISSDALRIAFQSQASPS